MHTKTYDVVRVENRRGGHSEHLGTVEAATIELAQERAAAYYDCQPQCSLVVTEAESDEPPKSTHTPGPWKVGYHANTQDGYTKSTIRGGRFMNEVVSMKQHVGGRNFEELFANARLIAAAPALLESLEQIVDSMSGNPFAYMGNVEEAKVMFAKAEAAIAAARGEEVTA